MYSSRFLAGPLRGSSLSFYPFGCKETCAVQERDFYFSKLREIELLCQQEGVKEQWDVMQHVENVLYAATEEEGTQARMSVRLTSLHSLQCSCRCFATVRFTRYSPQRTNRKVAYPPCPLLRRRASMWLVTDRWSRYGQVIDSSVLCFLHPNRKQQVFDSSVLCRRWSLWV